MTAPVAGWHGPDGITRRTSPLTIAVAGTSVVAGLVTMVIGGLIQAAATSAVVGRQDESSPFGLIIPGVVLILAGIIQVVRWITTTYTVFPTELVVDEGLINREHRVLPIARIQQADTHQNLIGQVIGLTEVKVDVAGASGSTQVKLRLLDRDTAVALRDYLLQRRAELHDPSATRSPTAPGPDSPTTGWADRLAAGASTIGVTTEVGEAEVLTITPWRLALGAATSSVLVVGIPAAVVVALWFIAFNVVDGSDRIAAFTAVGLGFGTVLVVIAIALVIGSTMLTHYGFTISLAGDDIHLRYGLLETRNLSVPRRRVQQVTVHDNPLRRRLGLVELHLHTAASPGGETTTRFTIPVLDAAAVDPVLHALMGDDRWRVPTLTGRGDAARRRAIVRRTALALVVVAVPAVVLRPVGLVLLLAVAGGAWWGQAAHRRAGVGRTATVVALAHGALHHRVDLVPVDRIQSARTLRTPFQRRVGLSTVLIDVAGTSRAPFLFDLDRDTAAGLRRELPRASGPST